MNKKHSEPFLVVMDENTILLVSENASVQLTEEGLIQYFKDLAVKNNDPSDRVVYPGKWISPIDKVSLSAFEGELHSTEPTGVDVGQKTIITASIDSTELDGVRISGKKELNYYDKAVHDAVVTLYVVGQYTYITTNMIYQEMTGKRNAHFTPKQAKDINDSVTKLMYSRVVIDASNEYKSRNVGFPQYDGHILTADRLTYPTKNNAVIHIFREPILYTYANERNQIGRIDAKLLDSPINKTKENILLESFLRRRIFAMKGKRTLSRTILYSDVYKRLSITSRSESSLRNKKMKVRNTVKAILNFYTKEGFINGYKENYPKSKRQQVRSFTIVL